MVGLEMLASEDAQLAFLGSDKSGELQAEGRLSDLSVVESVTMDCRLALMGPRRNIRDVPTQLGKGDVLTVATSYPLTLEAFAREQSLNLVVTATPSGGAEAFARSGRTDLTFDIVDSGVTQRDNDLLIYREGDKLRLDVLDAATYKPSLLIDELACGLRGVADTYFERLRQSRLPATDDDSYTVKLLRDQNALTKKLGEEFAEFLQAALRKRPSKTELRSEGADLLYAVGLVLLRDGVTIEEVLKEDIRRNQK